MPADNWQLGPFERRGTVLSPIPDAVFRCPVLGRDVAWAEKDLFNPSAVVKDGQVCLLVRGEDRTGRYAGTSRIGLAVSDDGVDFTVDEQPVIFPGDDEWQAWEWPGGCEDPRVVEAPDGGYVCTYTAFDGKAAHLFVASSPDLRSWTKHGPAFAGSAQEQQWSKSGAVVTEVRDGRLVAKRIDGRFWMYWGEGICFAATSDDLIRWTPLTFDPGADRWATYAPVENGSQWRVHPVPGAEVLQPCLLPRRGRFDSLLVEPGPPAIYGDAGITLIYNGVNHPSEGDRAYPALSYHPAQALFEAGDPGVCVRRAGGPFLRVEAGTDSSQVANVCFAQGLVLFKDRWLLYFGMGDSQVGYATAEAG